jgi:hypothetical protein
MFRRDYILRLIEQVAQSITRAFGFLAKKQPEEAQRLLDAGYGALGIDRELLCVLDGASVRTHLAEEEKLALAVQLLLCDAQLKREAQDDRAARRLLRAARKVFAQIAAPEAALVDELEQTSKLFA